MSEDRGKPNLLRRTYRTVTPPTPWRPDTEMTLIGWSMFLALLLLFVPLLPFLAILWVITRILHAISPDTPEEP